MQKRCSNCSEKENRLTSCQCCGRQLCRRCSVNRTCNDCLSDEQLVNDYFADKYNKETDAITLHQTGMRI